MSDPGALRVATPTDREIVLTRVFDAPRHLVFDAWTTPELLKRWFGPRGWSLVICEIDLRVGGAWHYVLRGPDGTEQGMHGTYLEIVRSERLVSTESFDDHWYQGEALASTVFAEEDGGTRLTSTVRYPSREVRDAVINTRMEHGVAEAYDRLAELLAATPAPPPPPTDQHPRKDVPTWT